MQLFSLTAADGNKTAVLSKVTLSASDSRIEDMNALRELQAKQQVEATKNELRNRERAEKQLKIAQANAIEYEKWRKLTPEGKKSKRHQSNADETHTSTASNQEEDSVAVGIAANLDPRLRSNSPHGAARSAIAFVHTKASAPGTTSSPNAVVPISSSYKYPFCLIHIHREKMKYRPGTGIRRMMRCFFRLCGTMPTCADAVKAAESLMLNAFMTKFGSNIERANEVTPSSL